MWVQHSSEGLIKGSDAWQQVIVHTNPYWSAESATCRTAGTAETAKVDFGSAA